MVVLVNTDTVCHAERLVAGEYSRSAIAFLVGIVPIRLIPVEGEVELSLLHLRLLQAEEIGIQFTEHLTEALALTGAKAVHIPRNQFHSFSLLS